MKEIRNWFPFYASDWITDTELQLCSLAEQGLLTKMMAFSWHNETPGKLEYTLEEIAFLLRVDYDEFQELSGRLVERHRIEVTSRGVLIRRLVSIGEEQQEKHLKRKNAGQLGGRGNKKTPEKKPSKKKQSSEASVLRALEEERFELFWAKVPNKIGKGYARECFLKALASGKVYFDEIMAGIPAYHQYERGRMNQEGYRPLHPSTWLNQERWSDESGYQAPEVFRAEINLADGTTKKWKGSSQEQVDAQMAGYILENNLEKKVSIKGYPYYERKGG